MLPMERTEPFEAIERIESSDAIDQRDDVVFGMATSYVHLEVHIGGAFGGGRRVEAPRAAGAARGRRGARAAGRSG